MWAWTCFQIVKLLLTYLVMRVIIELIRIIEEVTYLFSRAIRG
jgi:hypothetical protein